MLSLDKQAEAIIVMQHIKLGHLVISTSCTNDINHNNLLLLEGQQWVLERKEAKIADVESNKYYAEAFVFQFFNKTLGKMKRSGGSGN